MTALLLAVLLAAPVRELAEKIDAEFEAWDLQGASHALDELLQEVP